MAFKSPYGAGVTQPQFRDYCNKTETLINGLIERIEALEKKAVKKTAKKQEVEEKTEE